MERIFDLNEHPLSGLQHAAVAIRTINRSQHHVGIFHKSSNSDRVRLLHLAWHFDLHNDEPTDRYIWMDVQIPKARARNVAATCRFIWRANHNRVIPFGFSSPNKCFDEQTHRYLIGPSHHGLTCATFVLAVFQSAGISLANYQTWPTSREDDIKWQEHVLGQLRQAGADKSHIDANYADVGGIRFRPEEVAAAATQVPPADFEDCLPIAATIVERLLNEN